MISLNRLIQLLTGLFVFDIVSTFIAVGYMDAIELNPLLDVFGFTLAMGLKILVSAGAILVFYKYAPRTARVARPVLLFLVVLYGVVSISNSYQIIGVV